MLSRRAKARLTDSKEMSLFQLTVLLNTFRRGQVEAKLETLKELKNVVERAVYTWLGDDTPISEIVFDPFDSPWRPRPAAGAEVWMVAEADPKLQRDTPLQQAGFCSAKLIRRFGVHRVADGQGFPLPATILVILMLGLLVSYQWLSSDAPYGERIFTTIIETFEIVSGYVTSSLSFLRVAAFSLNHVALSLAVFTLADGMGTVEHWITLILGNIFIIVLEGIIVAIQTLRLEYYEGFSRYFYGDGTPFRTPRQVPADPGAPMPATYPDARGFQAIELPYKGGELAMVVLAPRSADGLGRIEAMLDADPLLETRCALSCQQETQVELEARGGADSDTAQLGPQASPLQTSTAEMSASPNPQCSRNPSTIRGRRASATSRSDFGQPMPIGSDRPLRVLNLPVSWSTEVPSDSMSTCVFRGWA